MSKGTVTISIDIELAWGNWDHLDENCIYHVENSDREIVNRLVEIFDRYRLAVTWAVVSALLDPKSAGIMQRNERLWYAPDVIDKIRSAKVAHDLGSHGGRHRYFDVMTDEEAADDLGFARHIHAEYGLPFESFVFPRNKVAKTPMLEHHGIKVYRGEDRAWHQRIRNRHLQAGRIANLIDKMLPITPEAVWPEADGMLVNLPGSMLFFGRNGLRKYAPAKMLYTKLCKGLVMAQKTGGNFHLWFHPSNFWYDTKRQLATFERFTALLARKVEQGEIEVKPMARFC